MPNEKNQQNQNDDFDRLQEREEKRTSLRLMALAAIFFTFLTGADVYAKAKQNTSNFAQKLPDFSLEDPAGKKFTDEDVSKNGVVIVVTAPIAKNKGAQEGWDKYLGKSKLGSKAKLIFLEDMKPSAFKGKALSSMKKEYRPGKEPILLIDKTGKVRKSFKVPAKKTVVLVYDNDGHLVHSNADKPSASGAKEIWQKSK